MIGETPHHYEKLGDGVRPALRFLQKEISSEQWRGSRTEWDNVNDIFSEFQRLKMRVSLRQSLKLLRNIFRLWNLQFRI